MFTGVFKDRTRTRASLRSADEVLAQLLRAKSLRPHHFVRRCEIGPFIVEHACQARSLIVELRNPSTANESRDRARIALLNEMGYAVVQVSRQLVLAHPDKVIEQVRSALRA
jgi:very-short-patch-repair endonuclease